MTTGKIQDAEIVADARIGELIRLQTLLEGPGLSLDESRTYVAEQLEVLYPLEFHVYRRRWEQLATGAVARCSNWPRLNCLKWRHAVSALAEEIRLAEILDEGESRRASKWRSLLMTGPEWEGDGE